MSKYNRCISVVIPTENKEQIRNYMTDLEGHFITYFITLTRKTEQELQSPFSKSEISNSFDNQREIVPFLQR